MTDAALPLPNRDASVEGTTCHRADFMVVGARLLSMEGAGSLLIDQAFAVSRGFIVDVGHREAVACRYRACHVIDLTGYIVMPAPIDAHCHLDRTSLDLDASDSLESQLAAINNYRAHATFGEVESSTRLGCESLSRAGYGAFLSHQNSRFLETAMAAGSSTETVSRWARISLDHPQAPDSIREAPELAVAGTVWHHRRDPRVIFGPMGLHACSLELMAAVAQAAHAHTIPIHTHVAESEEAASRLLARYGKTEIALLLELGALGPSTSVVHCNWITQADIEIILATGTRVVACPTSWVPDQTTDIKDLIRAGASVGLGSDSCCNVRELATAAFNGLRRCGADPRQAAFSALRMLTIHGAEALGIDKTAGSIAAGKLARLAAVRFDAEGQACHDIARDAGIRLFEIGNETALISALVGAR